MGKSSPGDVKAGGASVKINADSTAFSAVLGAAEKRLKAFGSNAMAMGAKLGGIGLALGAGLLGAVKSFADSGSALEDMSQRTGDTASNLSAIGYAAKQSGTDIEALEGGLGKMASTVAGAIGGEKAAVKLLNDLGLKAGDLKGKLPTEQLAIFADKIAGISDNDTKIDMVKSIFGKSGTALIPLLNEGSAGIGALTAEAEKLGLVMSDADAAGAAKLGDAFDKLTGAAGGIVNKIGSALAPAISGVVDYLIDATAAVSKFIGENKMLVVGIGIGVAALTAVGGALIGVGVLAYATGLAIGALGAVVGFLTSPFGIAIAVIAGLIAIGTQLGFGLAEWADLAKYMGDQFLSVFGGVLSTVKKTIGGIVNAISAGKIELAAKILWAGVQVAWMQGCEAIGQIWSKAMLSMEAGFSTFTKSVRHMWQDVSNWLAKPMAVVIANMQGLEVEDVLKSLEEENQGQKGKIDKEQNKWDADIKKRQNAKPAANSAVEAKLAELKLLTDQAAALAAVPDDVANKIPDAKKRTDQAKEVGSQMKSGEAQARNSSGAASSIAKAANSSTNDVAAKQLAAMNAAKINLDKSLKWLEQIAKNVGITITERA